VIRKICDLMPVPDLMKSESLLVIQPHPDDLEIGAGATVAKLIRAGKKVSCLTVTDGAAGTYDGSVGKSELTAVRKAESEAAAKLLGLKNLHWLNFPDGGNLVYDEIRAAFASAIRQLKPETVMVCDPWLPYEVHSDHIRTGLAAAEAAFLANMPRFCPVDIENGLQPHAVKIVAFYYTAYPNTFIDAADTWPLKMQAIDCHVSQFPGAKAEELKDLLQARAAALGVESGAELVEAFKVLSPGHLHIYEDAWLS
jgi:N,N'-diacetylchitobiose non-reducing end deacetylase